jgi:hypothetical protein
MVALYKKCQMVALYKFCAKRLQNDDGDFSGYRWQFYNP